MCELQWEAAQWNRVTRRLVSQTHACFMDLQKRSREMDGASDSMLVQYSQFYRSCLHECALGLQKKVKGMSVEDLAPLSCSPSLSRLSGRSDTRR